jgi:Uma2 family endonuclease
VKVQRTATYGPADAGRAVQLDEFEQAAFTHGFRYQLVAGRLVVTPAPNKPEAEVEDWFLDLLKAYAREHPDALRKVLARARIIARATGADTNVEPDVAAYREWAAARETPRWEGVTPSLVVEVISSSGSTKDTVRNRAIYARVPSIQEYWIVDPRAETAPSMLALTRVGRDDGWVEHVVAAGGTYRTPLLPGLLVDLSAIWPAGPRT